MQREQVGASEQKRGQFLYIIEAMLEYFISLIIADAYIAKVTAAIGMSPGLTGILTSFMSLGFLFQVFALFLARKKRVKRMVGVISAISLGCFLIIYLTPLIPIPNILRHVFFIIFLFVGYVLRNLVASPKMGLMRFCG